MTPSIGPEFVKCLPASKDGSVSNKILMVPRENNMPTTLLMMQRQLYVMVDCRISILENQPCKSLKKCEFKTTAEVLQEADFREQGRTTIQDLDLRREDLIKEEFGERCNFYIDDAVQKLENLGFVARDKVGRYYCVDPKLDNEIIGTTTEELVIIKAKQVLQMAFPPQQV